MVMVLRVVMLHMHMQRNMQKQKYEPYARQPRKHRGRRRSIPKGAPCIRVREIERERVLES